MSGIGWYQLKLFLDHASGVSMDALHVIAGVLIQIAVAVATRRSLASPLPLIAVFVAALLNEANDFRVELWPEPAMQVGEAAKDMALTMLLPALLFLVARYRPRLLG